MFSDSERREHKSFYYIDGLKKVDHFLIFAAFGKNDANRQEISGLQHDFPLAPDKASSLPGIPLLKCTLFPGVHNSAPAKVMNEALDWMEQWIFTEENPSPELKMAYRNHFKLKLSQLENINSPDEKRPCMEYLLKMSEKHQFRTDTEFTSQIKVIENQYHALQK